LDKKDDALTEEVQSRLQDLFGEKEEAPASASMEDEQISVPMEEEEIPASEKDRGAPEDSPIRDLKSTILSIDWEISDELLNALLEEIGKLENRYKNDKDLLLFLQLLGSVGKYIQKRKVNAHPGAIKVLNSVYNSLEEVLLSESITETERREKLIVQVEEFKKLKEQIALKKTDTPKKIDAAIQAEPRPSEDTREKSSEDMSSMTTQEALAYALSEIKQVIRDEFKALKTELKK
jgi:hypothetical protein